MTIKKLSLSLTILICFIFSLKANSHFLEKTTLRNVLKENLNLDNSCRASDSLDLVAFYQTTNGTDWTNSWDLDQPIDTWYGVSLNENGCVDSIWLPNNNLVGTLPDDLFTLSELEVLNLQINSLSGSIPNKLKNLAKLTKIDLSFNNLSGSIPEFHSLHNLSHIELTVNNLDESIDNKFIDLPALRHIGIVDNNLDGHIDTLLKFTDLVDLWIGGNNFFGQLTSSIKDLSNLEVLHIANSELTGPIPPELGLLSELRIIDLGDNMLTDTLPKELSNLTKLTELRLNLNNLSGCFDPMLSALCSNPNIVVVIDEGNNFDALWTDFCADGQGACERTCLEDADNDGICDDVDDFIQIIDTVHVYDTTFVTVYDTSYVCLSDTLFINVTVTDVNNESDTFEIKVYPNPTSDFVIVEVQDNQLFKTYGLRIINNLGMQVFSTQLNNTQIAIPITSIGPSGHYILQIFDDAGMLIESRTLVLI